MAAPRDHQRSLITIAAPSFDHAAATTSLPAKTRFAAEGWRIVRPAMVGIACRQMGGRTDDLLDDAVSYAAQKLWRAVQTGYQPTYGYVAILAKIAALAAATTLERSRTQRENPTISLDATASAADDDAVFAETISMVDDSELDEPLHAAELRTRLDRAARRAQRLGRPLAARILIVGIIDQPAATARSLGVTSKEVRDELDWMAREQYALFVVSDPRFDEHMAEVMGGTQLELMGTVMSA